MVAVADAFLVAADAVLVVAVAQAVAVQAAAVAPVAVERLLHQVLVLVAAVPNT